MSDNEIVEIIQQTKNKIDEEYEYGLSLRQIKNIAIKLLPKNLSKEDFSMALEYTSKMKAAMAFSIDHVSSKFNSNCKYYITIDYLIDRVLISMGLLEKSYRPIPFDDVLENEVNGIENNLKLDCMYSRKRALN